MAWTFLSRLLGGKPRQRPDLHIVIFTRKTCPLCDEAWELLRRHRDRYGFTLEAIDIDTSPDLVREHGEWVPVVAINGQVRFRGHVNEVLLKRLLEAP
jgi:glutaredoxin